MILKKRLLLPILCFVITGLIPHKTTAQESYTFRYTSLDSIVNTLEKQLSVRFYYAPAQTDTLLLSLQADEKGVLDALGKELKKNGFFFHHMTNNKWVILKEGLEKDIHPAFFEDAETKWQTSGRGLVVGTR